jgi:hypothetical protein
MSISTKITIPAVSFRRIINPAEQYVTRMYVAVIQAKNLPKVLEDWQEINPRTPKTTSSVARKIADSLENQPESFLFMNGGITLSSQYVSFNNNDNELTIELSDPSIHGLVDGGHTYAVIREAFDSLTEADKQDTSLNQAYLRLEILEGFTSKDEISDIAEARNTSIRSEDKSLTSLLKEFAAIKDVLGKEPYADRIAYKESEFNNDEKNIDIKEILSYLICFDREGFDDKNHPIIACTGKSETLKYAESNHERLQKYIPLLPQILRLRDMIYKEMPSIWNSNGGNFSRLAGVNVRKQKTVELPFENISVEYVIPKSFIYPVLASFRNLVKVSDNKCIWKENPITFFEKCKDELIQRLCEQALAFQNPNKLGKEKTTWQSCYDYIAMESLKSGL